MSTPPVSYYVSLISSEYQQSAKFIAFLTAALQKLDDVSACADGLVDDFDLDNAVGVQLDTLGVIIGQSRVLTVALTGVFMTWQVTGSTYNNLGWGSGVWKDPSNTQTSLVSLTDDLYRLVLKAKVAINNWDGTIPALYEIWNTLFAGDNIQVIIQDTQQMSMILGFSGNVQWPVFQQLVQSGLFSVRPQAVQLLTYICPIPDAPLMIWQTTGSEYNGSGWEAGAWGTLVIPVA
jgi:hypothetical protein